MEMTGLISQLALFTLCPPLPPPPLSLLVSLSIHFYLSSHSPASSLMTQMLIFICAASCAELYELFDGF